MEIGELSMHKPCVPGSFFSAHTQEPGNEASTKCQGQIANVSSFILQEYCIPSLFADSNIQLLNVGILCLS